MRTGPDDTIVAPWAAWVLVLLVAVVANLMNNEGAPRFYLLTSLVSAAVLLAIGRAAGLSWRELGLARDSWRVGLVWAATIIALVATVYAMGAALPATRGLFEDNRVQVDSAWELVFQAFIRIPFGTVLLEEVLFRGVILALAARTMGWLRGAMLSSVLFGLWHILPARAAAGANPTIEAVAQAGGSTFGLSLAVVGSVFATALAGLVFCWLRVRSGSLFASMGLHWATNGLGYLVAAVVRGGW
ncbi:MAG: CPBP family intramembrane glutamic endopeptidase [Actinomycetes bacterium]